MYNIRKIFSFLKYSGNLIYININLNEKGNPSHSYNNHPMLSHEELRFLPSNWSITPQGEKKILLYKEAGLSIRQIIRVMELEKNLKHGELSFLERDIRNLYGKVKKLLGVEDANNLKEY